MGIKDKARLNEVMRLMAAHLQALERLLEQLRDIRGK